MTNEEKINLIGQKILLLSSNLDKYKAELETLKKQLELLQGTPNIKPVEPVVIIPPVVQTPPVVDIPNVLPPQEQKPVEQKITYTIPPAPQQQYQQPKPKKDVNIEAYIGGSLISIIGIGILVIGIAIGVKYAIDEGWINPLTRIVLGYLAGALILFFAFRLKAKYKAFSAVLLSGGMASLYFTTFAAYAFYALLPQVGAFALMVAFTAFTVFAATMYNLQVISVVGLVGAYAVPFLLSDGSGRVEVLLGYMSVINVGVLILSFKKDWNVLNHLAYALSWLIFSTWFLSSYNAEKHQGIAIAFSLVFFLTFYVSLMAYKTVKKEPFSAWDVVRLLLNSFIYFSIGYSIFSDISEGQWLGLFTLGNAVVHFVFGYSVYINKQVDRKLFYLLMAMVLCFMTIAVPVQLEGNWVTLFWAAEVFLLFWIGRVKDVRFYEWLSFSMIPLALCSLMNDWGHLFDLQRYDGIKYWTPFLNITFFTALFCAASFAGVLSLEHKKPLLPEQKSTPGLYTALRVILPVLLLAIVYVSVQGEISSFWRKQYYLSEVMEKSSSYAPSDDYTYPVYDTMLIKLNDVWSMNYTLLFAIAGLFLALRKWKQEAVAWTAYGIGMFTVLLFLSGGTFELGNLRDEYLSGYQANYYEHTPFLVYIRYIGIFLFSLLLFLSYRLCKSEPLNKYAFSRIYAGSLVHVLILGILTVELTHLVHTANFGSDESYRAMRSTEKIGYTVLWSLYSFGLVIYGILRKQQIKRITGIIFFGISLIKLLLIDTYDLSTGYRVVAYIMLGVLLLLVSFLYQRFKTLLFGDDNENKNET